MKFNFFKKIWGRKEKKEVKDEKKEEKNKKGDKTIEIKKGAEFKILPLITEKTLKLTQENKYTFLVDPKVNKTQLKKTIENIFNVKVRDIKTINYKERIRGRTKIKSKRQKFKKVIIKLPADQKISIFE